MITDAATGSHKHRAKTRNKSTSVEQASVQTEHKQKQYNTQEENKTGPVDLISKNRYGGRHGEGKTKGPGQTNGAGKNVKKQAGCRRGMGWPCRLRNNHKQKTTN